MEEFKQLFEYYQQLSINTSTQVSLNHRCSGKEKSFKSASTTRLKRDGVNIDNEVPLVDCGFDVCAPIKRYLARCPKPTLPE